MRRHSRTVKIPRAGRYRIGKRSRGTNDKAYALALKTAYACQGRPLEIINVL